MACKCAKCISDPRLEFVGRIAAEFDDALQAAYWEVLQRYDENGMVNSDVINGLLNGIIIFAARNLFLVWRDAPNSVSETDIILGFNGKVREAFTAHKKQQDESNRKKYN